ncbi:hypothetical protein F7734_12125 [Scytonema sp. UIC 10036]|uniref:tellurite resistance TerB family protein n=1 Tax=Scytonema sp. UIC 10036 TaxID=2304196 RepID=UPI0012DA9754|nr:tellurite resistance TerB family protein [Scytonema sp. UIC 10036]MUG93140.1 hypothetical protein [Scytonema sp. UIC 10036]
MGKYDKIFNSTKTTKEKLTAQEAVAAIGVVTSAADSSLEEVDADYIADILWEFLEVFEEYSDDQMLELLDKLIAIAEEDGVGALFNAAKSSLSEDFALDAYAAGVSLLVDEEEMVIPKGKMNLLKKLQEALGIEDDEAKEVRDEVIAAFEEEEEELDDDEFLDDDEELGFDAGSEPQMYESPGKNFVVPIPVDTQRGGRVQAQEGLVSFSDDFGTLLRIDYFRLTPQQKKEIESVGHDKYLRSLLVEKYIPQEIVANLPEAQVKHTEYIEDALDGAYFVLVDMPEGSSVPKTGNNGTASRLNAYRGLLGFTSGNFLYVVSSQRSFFDGETPGSIEDESERIEESLLNFVDTIEFT